ncbi:MAG: tetratricopeptide repeat protein, partial [Cyanobacteria bacterium J06649_4]
MNTRTKNSHIEDLRRQADEYRQQGLWAKSLSLYEKIAVESPEDWQNYIAMGDANLNVRRWENAAESYTASLEIEESFDWAWHNLAVALFNLGDFSGVARCCKSLQLINPLFWEVNQSSSIVQRYKRVFVNILSEVSASSDAEQNHSAPNASMNQALSAVSSINLERSAEQPVDSSSANSEASEFESLYKQAQTLAKQGNHEEAIPFYVSAIALNEAHLEIHHFLGDSYLNLERFEEAITAYKTSLKYNPRDTWTHFNLGKALVRAQKAKQAAKYFSELLEIDPNFSQARLLLANALETQGKWSAAVEAYTFYLENVDSEDSAVIQKLNELLPKCAERSLNQLSEHLKRAYEAQAESTSESSKLAQAKAHLEKLNSIALDTFLMTNAVIEFPTVEAPKITIILILYNRAELTFSCLNSILKSNFKSLEVVIIDNKSTDRTRQLLKRVKGAKIVLNEENKHFLLACNQAHKLAVGEHLLFLNNDAQLLGNALENAVRTLESSPDIGAVGGKVILPDGSLQEAGSIIWQDGSCLGYGRGDEPDSPPYMFEREVDYCSGAFLLTPRQLFSDLGGFDESLQPAYYEETDYCVRVAKVGKRLIYNPDIVILHYEFGSSNSSEKSGDAIDLQRRNRKIFLDKHREWLATKEKPALKNILLARSALHKKKKILFIEDRIPHRYYGSGYTRGNTILYSLLNQNCFVTIYPTDLSYVEEWSTAYSDIPRNVEIMSGYGQHKLKNFLTEREGYYDAVIVSRPHNMQFVSDAMTKADVLKDTKIIYDAEAIFCEREFLRMKLNGENPSDDFVARELKKEMSLCRNAHHILSVSEKEANKFRSLGYDSVGVLGHVIEPEPTVKTFAERKDILFVGAIYEIDSPNADSILWFAEKVFPMIQVMLNTDI